MNAEQARPQITGTVLRVVIFEASTAVSQEVLKALAAAGQPAEAARVTAVDQLPAALDAGQGDLVIAAWDLPEAGLKELGQWLAGQAAPPPLLLAAPEIDAANYAKALRGGARYLLGLGHAECVRLVLARLGHPPPADTSEGRTAAQPPVPEQQDHGGTQDLLTGLYSHQYLFDAFDTAVAQCPDDDKFNALLYLRLDHFDDARRRLGEAGSDLLLSEFAGLMSNTLSPRDTPARLRDETFAVLIINRPRHEIVRLATDLQDGVREHHFAVLGQVFEVTCSIGICLFRGEDSQLQQVISKASLACEVAQGEGDGQLHTYDQTTDAGLRSAMEADQERRIRTALTEDRFTTVFQPVVNLHASPGDNYEMLLRMIDEHGREILPGEFMDAADHANLLPDIDRWVVRRGIQKLFERPGRETRLFIKLDGKTLGDEGFLPWLGRQLRDNGVPAERLVFEISETVAAKGTDGFARTLQGLRELHCPCVLEHAGRTGNAPRLIKTLAVDYIKIDGTLTHDLAGSQLHRDRVKSLIDCAKTGDKRVIVPFVEDAQALSLLWRWGVDYVQGNYVQRPEAKLNYVFDEQ